MIPPRDGPPDFPRHPLVDGAIAALYDRQGARMYSYARREVASDVEARAAIETAFAHLTRIWPKLQVDADLDRLALLLVREALSLRPPNAASNPVAGPALAAPIPVNEAARIAAVRRYEILDTPPDGTFDGIATLAARIFEVPIAIVSIVDHDRIWFKSHIGLDATEIPRDAGLCASAILQDEPWVLENAAIDPRSLANPIVAGEHGLHFYAGAPLHTRDGFNLGTLCVLDREPRAFPEPLSQLLTDLAALVVHELEIRLEARRAVSAVEARLLGADA